MAAGQRRPRGETRRRILRLAAQWLQQRGYHGFSFGQIAAALEIRSSAVHYHFATKEALVTAVFAAYREHFIWWREQLGQTSPGPTARLRRFLDLAGRNLERERVDPLGVAGVEYASLPSAACAEAEGLREDLLAFLADALAEGREIGEFAFRAEAMDEARVVLAAAQGALQLARLNGPADFIAVRRSLLEGLRRGRE